MCVVYLLSKGSHAKKDGGRLVIEKEGSVEASLPLLQVHHVVVGSGANISTPLLFFLIENHAEISFVDFRGKVLAGICGNRISWQRTKQQMDLFFDRQARLALIHTFLGEKLANQCKLLKYYAKIKKDQEVSFLADEIHFFQKKLLAESDEEVIRGLEGISSKKYFSAFPFLLNSHWEWNGRNRKPPRDPVNSLLSYGYAFHLRERDLLYYQLGMHYVRLYHGDTVAADSCWRKLSLPKVQIEDGAILYDIMSIYTPDLPLYGYDKGKQLVNLGNNLSTGTKMRKFLFAYPDAVRTYLCGLKLFVKEPEKDGGSFDIANDFRNSIDHMKYLSGDGMSLMDYYSKVFHLFFTYDTKLRKSISFIFNNIMMRYFLAASLKFHPGADTCDIELKELTSDKFTYKFVEKDSKGKSKNFEEVHNETYITLAEKLMNLRL